MPLQRDYRPTTFKQMIGNAETVRAIKDTLQREDHNHCILLTGDSGCGKTTLAYIIANKLGVLDYKSQDNPGFREINASDFRGIDTVRAIRSESMRVPVMTDVRVFFLDECHRLSNDAQEAFLKVMEEYLDLNYYIFATTNPESLKPTFKRRCAQYNLTPITDEDIEGLLINVADKEGVELPEEVTNQIVQDSTGSPGIALGILDAVIALSPEDMLAVAKRTAGVKNEVIALCRALIGKSSWSDVSKILEGLKGEEAEGIRRKVLGYCSAVLLKAKNDKAHMIMECFEQPMYNIGFPGVVLACYRVVGQ